MNKRLELINELNKYNINEENKVPDLLNEILSTTEYKEYLDIVYRAISSAQLYGFLSYLDENEIQSFIASDEYTSGTYKGNRILYYNKGQLSLIHELEDYKKVFFSAPTSFGKTSLVIEHILNKHHEYKQVLFIIPTNSLLEELYIKLSMYNEKLNLGYSITTQPKFERRKNNFLLLTPERFLIINEKIDVGRFDLIIMDETYKIVESENKQISDFIDNRSLRFRKVADLIGCANKVIFLSPFTYEITETMKRFLDKYEIKQINRQIEYVKRNVYNLESKTQFNHKEDFGYTLSQFKNSSIIDKIAAFLPTISDQQNIIYVGNLSYGRKIVNAVTTPPTKISNYRYSAFLEHLKSRFDIGEGYEWSIISGLEKKIGIYFSPIPRYIKKEVIRLFDEKQLNTLIVTTAFTEGVNTNARNLVFSQLISGPNSNKLHPIDILNVSGRAGRFAQNSIGNIYCLKKQIYDKVIELQENSTILLENYNYAQSDRMRIDFEIEMIDNQYLNQKEIEYKNKIFEYMEKLNLTYKDLSISLNVSNLWKIVLYYYFTKCDDDSLNIIFEKIYSIYDEDSEDKSESITYIFNCIKAAFINFNINVFAVKPYDIRAFDTKDEFIWGRLYKIYSHGDSKSIIKSNIKYIKAKFDEIKDSINIKVKKKKDLEDYFKNAHYGWILKYFNNDLSLNLDMFFTETFRFISNVIQYKIPFYLSFFVSVYKLYIKKNELDINVDQFEIKDLALLFEGGSIRKDYQPLFDYGISNDIINVLKKNGISFDQLITSSYDISLFDSYENMIIGDFIIFYSSQ